MPLDVFISDNSNIFSHLAFENLLLKKFFGNCLYIWQSKSVVIGRFQNPWAECDPEFVQKHGYVMARRDSGGGTVVHDNGNLNISFIGEREDFNPINLLRIISHALNLLGYKTQISERYDILYKGKKCSGSAMRHYKGRSLHHCTLLYSSDVAKIAGLLVPKIKNIKSNASPSKRAEIISLDINKRYSLTNLIDALIMSFEKKYGNAVLKREEDYLDEVFFSEKMRLSSWEWIFGKTPDFVFEKNGRFREIKKRHINKLILKYENLKQRRSL